MKINNQIYFRIENFIMFRLAPLNGPGPILSWIFKIPILYYKMSLGGLVGKRFLMLITTGRKTGKRRQTPLEYSYDPPTDTYEVMAGWGGHTDWRRNALANPLVHVQVGNKSFYARAEPMSSVEVAQVLINITRINPGAIRMFSRWSKDPIDGSEANWLKAAKHFPMFRLVKLS
jgi:deazaflavin-dependent oxidoreductase (nitroreductase family)